MPIEVGCPACGAMLRARDTDAGKTKTCPKCRKPVIVPGEYQGDFSDLEPVPAPAPAEQTEQAEQPPSEPVAEPAAEAERKPGAAKWIAALVLLGLAVGICAFFAPRGPSLSKDETSVGSHMAAAIREECRQLSEKATAAASEGRKDEAIELYTKLIAKVEEMDEVTARNFGLKDFRQKLRALQTGKPLAEIIAEDKAKEAENRPKPVVDPPAQNDPPAEPAPPEAAAPDAGQ